MSRALAASFPDRWPIAVRLRLPLAWTLFLVATGLRLVAFLIFYVGSIATGHNGVVDPYDSVGIDRIAWYTAQEFHAGRIPYLPRYDLAGTWEVGYDYFVAAIYFVVGHFPEVPRAIQTALAGFTAPAAYLAARRTVLGEEVARRAGWLVALWPLSIYWAGYDLLKDPAIWFLMALVMLAITARTARWIVALGVMSAFLMLFVRLYLGYVLTLATPVWILMRRRWREACGAALALVAGQMLCLAIGYPSLLAPLRPYQGNGVAVSGITAGVAPIASRARTGSISAITGAITGDKSGAATTAVAGSGSDATSLLKHHPTQLAGRLVVGAAITLLGPRPALKDIIHPTIDSGMYPGLLVWIPLIPFTLLGFWRGLRTRDGTVLALLSLAVGLWLLISFLYAGAFRQRELTFPSTLIFTSLGLQAPLPRRWRWGYAAFIVIGLALLLLRETRVI